MLAVRHFLTDPMVHIVLVVAGLAALTMRRNDEDYRVSYTPQEAALVASDLPRYEAAKYRADRLHNDSQPAPVRPGCVRRPASGPGPRP